MGLWTFILMLAGSGVFWWFTKSMWSGILLFGCMMVIKVINDLIREEYL
jgi:hypothetical protein